jgi:hypothetical protein
MAGRRRLPCRSWLLTATPEVKRDIATVARGMEIGTLGMSARLNALPFTGGAFDLGHLFGCFIPAAISGATPILARLTRVRRGPVTRKLWSIG